MTGQKLPFKMKILFFSRKKKNVCIPFLKFSDLLPAYFFYLAWHEFYKQYENLQGRKTHICANIYTSQNVCIPFLKFSDLLPETH